MGHQSDTRTGCVTGINDKLRNLVSVRLRGEAVDLISVNHAICNK